MKLFKQLDCFKINFKTWILLGIYPLSVSRPFLYQIYAKIVFSSLSVMYSILLTLNLYFIPNRIDSYIEELIFYFTVLSIMCKGLTISFKKEKLKDVINILQSDIFQPETEEAVEIITKAKKTIIHFFSMNWRVCLTSHYVHIFTPILNHIIFKAELFLPVCSYLFLSDHTRKHYVYPLYFYQCIGMHFHVLLATSIDSFFVGLLILLIAQLKILEDKFLNVTENFEANSKYQKHDANLIIKLNKVFVHYAEVTKFRSCIEEIFSISVFVHFSMGSFIICMCLIRFTMPAPWQYFIFLSTYTIAMLIQIFIPCWFGTQIMEKSCQLGHSIYSCDWTPRSKPFKNNLILFVERTKRPLTITGWKMMLLSLTTFVSIMNTAYSFFTVLRQMQSR